MDFFSQLGLSEHLTRLGTHLLMLAVILAVAWGLRTFYVLAQIVENPASEVSAFAEPSPTPEASPNAIPLVYLDTIVTGGVSRRARLHTDLPSEPRLEVITYTVKPGENIFDIAEKFGLRVETILWANQSVLSDDPHNLRPEQELIILPVDGTYHRWSSGDSISGVADFYGVNLEAILEFPGNHLDIEAGGQDKTADISPGTWLIIPGGYRPFVSWSAPQIPRDNPSVAKILGPGACEEIQDGAIGKGVFDWPADSHYISGYDYHPEANHAGIDIHGAEGDPVYAADSGVVVYAGWNNWGYGNVIVINHGNGWQTLYAHLSAIYVTCGQSVEQGVLIGAIGDTGSAAETNLHFEMMFEGEKVNPWAYLP